MPLMSCLGQSGSFVNSWRAFSFSFICEVPSEAARSSTMQSGFSGLFVQPLVLRSLNAITKEATIVAMILGRASPDPGLSPQVELSGGDAGGLLNLLGIGKALA